MEVKSNFFCTISTNVFIFNDYGMKKYTIVFVYQDQSMRFAWANKIPIIVLY